jgi:hypothetical protein
VLTSVWMCMLVCVYVSSIECINGLIWSFSGLVLLFQVHEGERKPKTRDRRWTGGSRTGSLQIPSVLMMRNLKDDVRHVASSTSSGFQGHPQIKHHPLNSVDTECGGRIISCWRLTKARPPSRALIHCLCFSSRWWLIAVTAPHAMPFCSRLSLVYFMPPSLCACCFEVFKRTLALGN